METVRIACRLCLRYSNYRSELLANKGWDEKAMDVIHSNAGSRYPILAATRHRLLGLNSGAIPAGCTALWCCGLLPQRSEVLQQQLR